MGQKQRLLDHLLSGKTTHRAGAYHELGIFELSSRVGELEALGHVIPRKSMKVTNRWNEDVRVTLYWMEV